MLIRRKKGPCPLKRYVLAHYSGCEYARHLAQLPFHTVDCTYSWSVFADYDEHQVCIGRFVPVPSNDGDFRYFLYGANGQYAHYVKDASGVPSALKALLVRIALVGEFSVYRTVMQCVTAKPVIPGNGSNVSRETT